MTVMTVLGVTPIDDQNPTSGEINFKYEYYLPTREVLFPDYNYFLEEKEADAKYRDTFLERMKRTLQESVDIDVDEQVFTKLKGEMRHLSVAAPLFLGRQ